jgi:hypothetical protein
VPLAVFDEDVIATYHQFLARRRAERPSEEYRAPTTGEWSDFHEHFDRRRVELGSCGRPYGTPCQHEHACLTELILSRRGASRDGGASRTVYNGI